MVLLYRTTKQSVRWLTSPFIEGPVDIQEARNKLFLCGPVRATVARRPSAMMTLNVACGNVEWLGGLALALRCAVVCARDNYALQFA